MGCWRARCSLIPFVGQRDAGVIIKKNFRYVSLSVQQLDLMADYQQVAETPPYLDRYLSGPILETS